MNEVKESRKDSKGGDNFSSNANLTENLGLQSTISLAENVEDIEYEPYDHREVKHPNSDFGSMVHLLKSFLGTGILAMPSGFSNAGIVFGSIGTVVIGFICAHCLYILAKVSHELCKKEKVPSMNFAETCSTAFKYGPKSLRGLQNGFKHFVDWSLVGTYVGAACVYVMLIAQSFHEVVNLYQENNLSVKLYCVIIMFPLILIGQIRNLKYLVPFSLVANVLLLVTFGIVMSDIFVDIPPTDDKPLITPPIKWPLFISTVIFAMEGVGVIMPIENDMKNPSHFLGCPGVFNIAMIFVVSLYVVIGLFGYLKYGAGVQGNVVSELGDDIPAQIAKICIGTAILFTYGLQFYIPMEILFRKTESVQNPKYHNLTQIVVRTLCVILSVVIAIAVPQLDLLISLVGALFFTTLSLFIPAVVELVFYWNNFGFLYWRFIKCVLIALFSLLALVSGVYLSLYEIISGDSDTKTV